MVRSVTRSAIRDVTRHLRGVGLRAAPLALALTFAASGGLRSAHAQSAQTAPAGQPSKAARDEAATRFKKGIDLFKETDYAAALVEFRRAYELAPTWQVLYNIGQVQFQLQDYAGALPTLERYLSEGGRQVPAARRTEVEADIQTLKGRIAFLDVTVNVADADIAVDDTTVGTSPLSKPVTVNAGRRRVAVSREGYTPQSRVVEVASGDTVKASFDLVERGANAASTAGSSGDTGSGDSSVPQTGTGSTSGGSGDSGSNVPWIGWGVTGGLAAGAVVFGVLALGASSDLQDLRGTRGVAASDLQDASSKATTMSVVCDALTGAALIAGGISLYFTLRTPPSDSAASAPRTRPSQATRAPRATWSSASRPQSSGPELQIGISPRGAQVIGSF
ncbi:PEGA domain-containing protein [Chondromyces apiculatus]|uniref:PEGA domain-containing protein n=1 Tax=Chondromyces apiculatus TaxID=51 RepID=UPI0018CC4A4D|nr:PEGA domain-containing protein [Chondromyces apiculatus]